MPTFQIFFSVALGILDRSLLFARTFGHPPSYTYIQLRNISSRGSTNLSIPVKITGVLLQVPLIFSFKVQKKVCEWN